MNIRGKSVLLRAIEATDLPTLQVWANDPELQRSLDGWRFPTSLRDQEAWLSSLSCNSLNQRFAIEVPDMGLVGTANLVDIDWKNRNAFHGMMLGAIAARGRGLATDTVMAAMRYVFDELGFARLSTSIIEYNQPSLDLYVGRCGWKEEGRQRNAYYRSGRYWQRIMVGITHDDYRELLRKTDYWSNDKK
jgi:RimJ/RimL family protein N-acetyltransferase